MTSARNVLSFSLSRIVFGLGLQEVPSSLRLSQSTISVPSSIAASFSPLAGLCFGHSFPLSWMPSLASHIPVFPKWGTLQKLGISQHFEVCAPQFLLSNTSKQALLGPWCPLWGMGAAAGLQIFLAPLGVRSWAP